MYMCVCVCEYMCVKKYYVCACARVCINIRVFVCVCVFSSLRTVYLRLRGDSLQQSISCLVFGVFRSLKFPMIGI